MSNTATATAKNTSGEDVSIEIQIPDANRAAEWNAAIQGGAAKAGVELPGASEKPAAAVAAAGDTKKDDQPTTYRATLTVNGAEMVFEDTDPAKVLEQYSAAVSASQLAAPPASTSTSTTQADDKKSAGLTAAEMFDIGTRLIGGDPTGLDTLLQKSGAIGRYLETQGVSIHALKTATQKTQTDAVFDDLTTAKNGFIQKVKAGEIDFPGGTQNEKMMGIMLARVQAEDKAAGRDGKFTVQSFERAYDLMKKEGLVFPAESKPNTQQTTTVTEKKTAPSSTITGTAGSGKENTPPAIDPNRRWEIDFRSMSVQDASRAWNDLITQGVKPEQINVIR